MHYTETGAESLNLNVDDEDTTIAELVLGAKYAFQAQIDNGTLTPEFKLMAAYDFAGDRAVSNQQFVGGGDAFQVKGADVAQFSILYGAGVTWHSADGLWELTADYDGRKKSDYISHGARLELRYNF
ncbi:autotransporter outer membrane beta-barrel domain-containing protein [Terasakiella sp. SH-1]|uniref:autotransporter outer membrane beta-barrel domain-containing protein n=1 Tax=Terasakiella sp. SH-1 TaxID=2560057 RepID=UPI001430F281|nr:autotransporter outer membrane beta-barrel domain-containing protein [Terasakiella sp. SH-1]